MIGPYLERARLTVLPRRLETVTILGGPVSQHSTVLGTNQSGGVSDLVFDGTLDGKFDSMFGFPGPLTTLSPSIIP
jgi:hypothetical protein